MQTIPIMLDKERHLKWTMGGMEKFQEATGVDVLSADTSSFSQKEIIPFLWACLLWEDRTLKLEDVKFMVDIEKLKEFIELVPQIMGVALPQSSGETTTNPQSLPIG